jgi:hypothetical protein
VLRPADDVAHPQCESRLFFPRLFDQLRHECSEPSSFGFVRVRSYHPRLLRGMQVRRRVIVTQGSERPRARRSRVPPPPFWRIERLSVLALFRLRILPLEEHPRSSRGFGNVNVGEVRVRVGEGVREEVRVGGRGRFDQARQCRLQGLVEADEHVVVQRINDRTLKVDHHLKEQRKVNSIELQTGGQSRSRRSRTYLEIRAVLNVVRVEQSDPTIHDERLLVKGAEQRSVEIDDLDRKVRHLGRIGHTERDPRFRRDGDVVAAGIEIR